MESWEFSSSEDGDEAAAGVGLGVGGVIVRAVAATAKRRGRPAGVKGDAQARRRRDQILAARGIAVVPPRPPPCQQLPLASTTPSPTFLNLLTVGVGDPTFDVVANLLAGSTGVTIAPEANSFVDCATGLWQWCKGASWFCHGQDSWPPGRRGRLSFGRRSYSQRVLFLALGCGRHHFLGISLRFMSALSGNLSCV